jgi:glycosyltransferase involved in cell wall biosynthesis
MNSTAPLSADRHDRKESSQTDGAFPLVTIITVVRNGAAHLSEAIESVLTQSWPNIEYIIIDGDSTDGTLDIIQSYDRKISYWVSEPDGGIFDAMNKGIALAHGELIGLLNADDWYEPDAVEAAASVYRNQQVPGIYYGDKYLIHVDLAIKYEFPASLDFWRGMTICHQAMFIHRDVYARLGCYDTSYRLAADFDFLIRAIRSDVPLVNLLRFIVNFRDDGASAKALVAGNIEINSILRSYFGFWSSVYLKNLLLIAYGLTAAAGARLIGAILGDNIRKRTRLCYYRLSRGKHARK